MKDIIKATTTVFYNEIIDNIKRDNKNIIMLAGGIKVVWLHNIRVLCNMSKVMVRVVNAVKR